MPLLAKEAICRTRHYARRRRSSVGMVGTDEPMGVSSRATLER